ncbi:hypothetical protein [Mycobacterium asiaticum]|uniref:Uncharacterized protein n=1 Tax=Mycobacterium asiaticum TaxID=1790 RepID=A0A1A3NL33_MYCAS|nr:hypothetical protein [Mycobacterium asiaticum]OBK22536.1 hypothetical protein A5635_21715 [Mycobacterium asiaticum]
MKTTFPTTDTRSGAHALLDACADADQRAAEYQRVLDENTALRARIADLEQELAWTNGDTRR